MFKTIRKSWAINAMLSEFIVLTQNEKKFFSDIHQNLLFALVTVTLLINRSIFDGTKHSNSKQNNP